MKNMLCFAPILLLIMIMYSTNNTTSSLVWRHSSTSTLKHGHPSPSNSSPIVFDPVSGEANHPGVPNKVILKELLRDTSTTSPSSTIIRATPLSHNDGNVDGQVYKNKSKLPGFMLHGTNKKYNKYNGIEHIPRRLSEDSTCNNTQWDQVGVDIEMERQAVISLVIL